MKFKFSEYRDRSKVQPNGNSGRYNAQPAQYNPINDDWANRKSFKSTTRRIEVLEKKRMMRRRMK